MHRLISAERHCRIGLGNDASLPVTKEQAKTAIESMGLSATIRGEALSLAQFAELANRLKEA